MKEQRINSWTCRLLLAASFILISMITLSPQSDAADYTVEERDGAVVQDDDERNDKDTSDKYEEVDAESVVPDGASFIIQTVKFTPPHPWSFKQLSGNLYYEAIPVGINFGGGIGPEPIKNTSGEIQVAWTVTEMPSADGWPLWIEGNMKRPGGGGGAGAPPLAHWGAQINVGTPTGISVAADKDTVNLGDDLLITYTVNVNDPGQAYDKVDITIKNDAGTVVASWLGEPGTSGNHDLKWEDAKWADGTAHAGAFANPNNGNYTITAIAHKGVDTETDEALVNTRFVVTFSVTDEKPANAIANADRVSGLEDLDSIMTIKVVGGSTITIPGTDITITDGTGHSPPLKYVKDTEADSSELQTLDNGTYEVQISTVRDDIGNFADGDTQSSGIQDITYEVDLY